MFDNWLKTLANWRNPLRPPGAISEKEFLQTCIHCMKCAEICSYGSIQIAHGKAGLKMGTPFLFPREVPCYLCMECPPVCPSGALQPAVKKSDVKMGLAVIDRLKCFPYNGIICRSCYERCPIYTEAITLENELYPVVHDDKCVGCGICENVCPTEPSAITIQSSHEVI